MINLLKETLDELLENGKSPEDVRWVGGSGYATDWAGFAALADFKYCNGFGTAYIASDLCVVGDNWWLERSEYDGSEGWDFKTLPIKPEAAKPLERVLGYSLTVA
jgi:hypothetical protein